MQITDRKSRPSRALLLFVIAGCVFHLSTDRAGAAEDHLVPVHAFFADTKGSGSEYRKLWQEKLLLTPGDVARYVYLPAPRNTEQVVSIYQRPNSGQGVYWVTVTEPSGSLWECIPSGDEKFTGRVPVDPRSISVRRCDAPLPESTALVVHRVWLAMLLQTRGQRAEALSLDGSTEIFSVKGPHGKELQGQIPVGPKKNALALLDIGNLLAQYCKTPEPQRPKIAGEIERAASDLLGRVTKQTSR
jgi:hypothetical protein